MPCGRMASIPVRRSHSRNGSEGISPFSQSVALSLERDSVRVAICTAALTGSHVLVLPDVWRGMIMYR